METAALPLCYYPKRFPHEAEILKLLDFLVTGALTAERTELRLLNTFRHCLLVARRRIVATLALGARQCNLNPHDIFLPF